MSNNLLTAEQKDTLTEQLQLLLNQGDDIYAAIICSIDGHPIVTLTKPTNAKAFNDARISAMTSSCMALGEKIANESGQNGCNFVVTQNQNGYIVLKRVSHSLVLTALADKSTNIGMPIWAVQCATDKISEKLNA